jgi:hypothetical protein
VRGARAEFQNLDTNRDGFVERPEAEALVHADSTSTTWIATTS